MKKNYIFLIVWWFLILFIPIAYYFCYALPQHNLALQKIEQDRLDYQKEKDRKAEEAKELEQLRIEREKEEKLERYQDCISAATRDYNNNLSGYCNMWYQECKQNIDDYNRNLSQKYDYYWNSNEKWYWDCEKYKFKNNQCFLWDKYSKERENAYERAIKYCETLK